MWSKKCFITDRLSDVLSESLENIIPTFFGLKDVLKQTFLEMSRLACALSGSIRSRDRLIRLDRRVSGVTTNMRRSAISLDPRRQKRLEWYGALPEIHAYVSIFFSRRDPWNGRVFAARLNKDFALIQRPWTSPLAM